MATHELKILPKYYEPVLHKLKTFEIRKNDRGFAVGDELILKEFEPTKAEYTGWQMRQEICYMTDYAQRPGYVVMAIRSI